MIALICRCGNSGMGRLVPGPAPAPDFNRKSRCLGLWRPGSRDPSSLWKAPGSRQLFAPVIEGLPGTGADVSRLFPGPLAQFLPALHNVLKHVGNINSSPAIRLR